METISLVLSKGQKICNFRRGVYILHYTHVQNLTDSQQKISYPNFEKKKKKNGFSILHLDYTAESANKDQRSSMKLNVGKKKKKKKRRSLPWSPLIIMKWYVLFLVSFFFGWHWHCSVIYSPNAFLNHYFASKKIQHNHFFTAVAGAKN